MDNHTCELHAFKADQRKGAREPNFSVCLREGVRFVLLCYVSSFTFSIKQNTFVKVYHEFVNSATASPFNMYRFQDTPRSFEGLKFSSCVTE